MKKASRYRYLEAFKLSLGRGERIRTFVPLIQDGGDESSLACSP